ncbi:MAG: 4Fe-4S dicluster domain-containing protein [Oscillospiraceae bacterium]|jgi:Na+-translocating ferredoxin:NAD+ oxidoreductase RnfC subunit|nr:4Fe-4S dicluster domain-containing protein [Oscillospiraceae bacterium]
MSLIEQIRKAGIVGCGGAGFPTHAKLAAQGVDTLIINAAECEPLLRTDRTLLKTAPNRILTAAEAVKAHLGAVRAVIALKESYTEEIAALEATGKIGENLSIYKMKSTYPAGDEHVMVYEVTGRIVPPGGLPLAVGCVVSNAATMYAVSHAMQDRPFIKRILTVTGAVREPLVLSAPLGTSFAACLSAAGGPLTEDYIVVNGGPMMGKPLTKEEADKAVVTKTTGGFLVLPRSVKLWQYHQRPLEHSIKQAASACIQCSFCTGMCPRYLLGHPIEPHKIMRAVGGGKDVEMLTQHPAVQGAAYCCECGICELVACPMGLRPRQINQYAKQLLRAQGIRPTPPPDWKPAVRPFRDERRIPTKKAAQSAGVLRYYHTDISKTAELTPQEVCIAVNSHIGVPAEPTVTVGERVRLGQRIAAAPEGKLSADYHASIAGTVLEVKDNTIRISAA